MRIAIGSDHRGIQIRQTLIKNLAKLGFDTNDVGPQNVEEGADYPDVASDVGHMVASQEADRGILFCGTGIGMSIAANKVHGIRAAVCHDENTVALSRSHNDANILCLDSDMDDARVELLAKIWLETEFEGGRHARRVDKIMSMEGNEQK